MDSLNNSTFFDERTIAFLRKLFNTSGKVTPLSANEQKFIDRKEELEQLDYNLDRQLISKLTKYKNYAPVVDSVFFLLEAQERGILEKADLVLQMAVREERVLTRPELDEGLEEIESMPADWIVNLLGKGDGDRHAVTYDPFPKSKLNLDAMRDFK